MMKKKPLHVAIIMDGNGRWGKTRGMSRSQGHYAGAQTMERIIGSAQEQEVDILTLYAFSSENWSRPRDEVNYLMHLPVKFFQQKLPEFIRRNIRISLMGDIQALPAITREVMMKAVEETERNSGLIVNFAFNYGGRDDILHAVRQVASLVSQGLIELEDLDETLFQRMLYSRTLPEPDLIIRTGGEKRISNFLLWQCSDSELYFSDVLFPDFTPQHLAEAIEKVRPSPAKRTYLSFG